jgi:hypothetical protein
MRWFVLFIVFVLTVALLTGAWWMAFEGYDGTSPGFPPSFTMGILIAFIVQTFSWNLACRFSVGWKPSLGAGFPIAATLMALGLGDFLVLFLPHSRDYIFDLGISWVQLGMPAFVIGALWFAKCWRSWKAGLQASRDSQSSVHTPECNERPE